MERLKISHHICQWSLQTFSSELLILKQFPARRDYSDYINLLSSTGHVTWSPPPRQSFIFFHPNFSSCGLYKTSPTQFLCFESFPQFVTCLLGKHYTETYEKNSRSFHWRKPKKTFSNLKNLPKWTMIPFFCCTFW